MQRCGCRGAIRSVSIVDEMIEYVVDEMVAYAMGERFGRLAFERLRLELRPPGLTPSTIKHIRPPRRLHEKGLMHNKTAAAGVASSGPGCSCRGQGSRQVSLKAVVVACVPQRCVCEENSSVLKDNYRTKAMASACALVRFPPPNVVLKPGKFRMIVTNYHASTASRPVREVCAWS